MAKPTYQLILESTKLMVKPKMITFKSYSKQRAIEALNPNMFFLNGWYSSVENLKLLRRFGYNFFCSLKENRLVNPTNDREGEVNLCTIKVSIQGLDVYLKGFGLIKVFRKVSKDKDVSYYGCDVLKAGTTEYGVLASLG